MGGRDSRRAPRPPSRRRRPRQPPRRRTPTRVRLGFGLYRDLPPGASWMQGVTGKRATATGWESYLGTLLGMLAMTATALYLWIKTGSWEAATVLMGIGALWRYSPPGRRWRHRDDRPGHVSLNFTEATWTSHLPGWGHVEGTQHERMIRATPGFLRTPPLAPPEKPSGRTDSQ